MLQLREKAGDLLSVRIRNSVIQLSSLPSRGAISASGLEAYLRPVPTHSRFYLVSAPLFFSGGVHIAEDHLSWGRRLAARPLALPVGFPLGAGEPPHAFLRISTPSNPPTGTLFIWRSWAASKSRPGDLSLQARDSDHRAERFVVQYQSGGGRWAVRQFLGRVFPAFIAGVTPVRQSLVLVPLPNALFLSRGSMPWSERDGELRSTTRGPQAH